MRFDRRFAIVVTVSLFWALLVSAVFYRLARGPEAGAASSKNQKLLVVAARALPLGDTITRDSVRTRSIPEALFPKGGFSRVEEVLDRPVVSPILSDEPIMESRIAARGAGLGVAPMIPDGMRAISVRVNDVVGVAGFVLPGMHVDVLSTGRAPQRDEMVTRTVLENITVLSVGQTVQVDGRSQAINAAVVTLLVDPEQAEALALANSEGRIQLVLRNSTDQASRRPPGRQSHELFGSPAQPETRETSAPVGTAREGPSKLIDVAAPPARVAADPAPVVHAAENQMLIIRGSKKTVEQFGTARPGQ